MNDGPRTSIPHIFLDPRPRMSLMMTPIRLRMPFPVLKQEITEGTIVAAFEG